MIDKLKIIMLFVVCSYMFVTSVLAEDPCCAKCGCHENLRRVCRPICTTKYIEITCWDSVCEDVCISPRGHCNECRPVSYNIMSFLLPGESRTADKDKGVKIRSCNKLVRKTYLQPVPTVVWVVEYLCCDCCGDKTYSIMQDPAESAEPDYISAARQTGGVPHGNNKENRSSEF